MGLGVGADAVRGSLGGSAAVAHGNAEARRFQHRNVVIAVTHGHAVRRVDARQLRQFPQTCALVNALLQNIVK